MSAQYSVTAPDFEQDVTLVVEAFGLMVTHSGREFHCVEDNQGHRCYLRNTIAQMEVVQASTPQGITLDVHQFTMPLSYLIAKGLVGLMPQAGQDRFFGRDGSQDQRHHMDDAANLGLDVHLTNAMLADLPALLQAQADALAAQADPGMPADPTANGGQATNATADPLGSILI